MKKVIYGLLTITMVVSLVGCSGSAKYKPGVYTGSSKGHSSEVKVTATFSKNKIEKVSIDAHGETASIGQAAVEQLMKNIQAKQNAEFDAEVQDVMRGGLRVQLLENGASMFVPASTLHPNKDEMQVNADELALYIQGERRYKIGDLVKVKLTEVREETRSIIGQLII